jgi:hypothetical protein
MSAAEMKALRYAEDSSNVAAYMAKQAAKAFAAGSNKWPSYTTEAGRLSLALAWPASSGDAWRWQLDGVPLGHGRAVRLIAERMAAKLG